MAELSHVLKDFRVFVQEEASFPRASESLGQAAPAGVGVASAAWEGWGVLQTVVRDGGQACWL